LRRVVGRDRQAGPDGKPNRFTFNRGYQAPPLDGVWATAPYFHNVWGPFVDEVVGTFFLALFVCAVTDEFNQPPTGNMTPWIVGFIVMAVGISFGANSGYAINPARDFGPRLCRWAAGWGKLAFPGDYANISTYFWIPIVGPLVGAAIASFLYDLGIKDILMARRGPEPGVTGVGETVQDREPGSAEPGVRCRHAFEAVCVHANGEVVCSIIDGRGDFVLNVSVDVSSIALIKHCWEKGAMYLDTCIEPWPGGYTCLLYTYDAADDLPCVDLGGRRII